MSRGTHLSTVKLSPQDYSRKRSSRHLIIDWLFWAIQGERLYLLPVHAGVVIV
jgi:hypothetical protein